MAPATHNHTSRLTDRPRPLNLLDARDFADLASRVGIQQPAQALMLDGRLLRIHVGRRAYYRWDDVLPLMPDWAREAYAYLGTHKTNDRARPAYPAPGSAIPGQPGFVVAECEHRVAASEWRVGFRTCERCQFSAGVAR